MRYHKKKIGLFLGRDSLQGGVFRYEQLMLDAVATLPKDKFSVVVGYLSSDWHPYLKNYDHLESFQVKRSFCERAARKMLGNRVFTQFGFIGRFLSDQECHLWILPGADIFNCPKSISALCVIHDLMHRYERQFPEMSADGEYEERETHYKSMCSWAKGILADSEMGKQHVYDSYHYHLNNIFVLPYTVPRYLLEHKADSGVVDKYQLPKKFLFYPAKIWKHRNHVRLVEAISRLSRECPDVHLVLAGAERNGYEDLLRCVKRLHVKDHVRFLGHIPEVDVLNLYCCARAMIYPSLIGPTNIPTLEAFALGCPAALSNIYEGPEIAGNAALLFDPESVEDIVDCIRRLWCDDSLCAVLVQRGHQKSLSYEQTHFNERLHGVVGALTMHPLFVP